MALPHLSLQTLLWAACILGQAPFVLQEPQLRPSRPWRAYSALLTLGVTAVRFSLYYLHFADIRIGSVEDGVLAIRLALIAVTDFFDGVWTVAVQPGALLRLLQGADLSMPIKGFGVSLFAIVSGPGIFLATFATRRQDYTTSVILFYLVQLYENATLAIRCLLFYHVICLARGQIARINDRLMVQSVDDPDFGEASAPSSGAVIQQFRREYSEAADLVHNVAYCFQHFLFRILFDNICGVVFFASNLVVGCFRGDNCNDDIPKTVFIFGHVCLIGTIIWMIERFYSKAQSTLFICHALANSPGSWQNSAHKLEYQFFADQIANRPLTITVWGCWNITFKDVLEAAVTCISYFIVMLQLVS